MSFNQTRDLMDVARQFHMNLAELYEKMTERAATEEARALIGTLIEHEQTLEKKAGTIRGTEFRQRTGHLFQVCGR